LTYSHLPVGNFRWFVESWVIVVGRQQMLHCMGQPDIQFLYGWMTYSVMEVRNTCLTAVLMDGETITVDTKKMLE